MVLYIVYFHAIRLYHHLILNTVKAGSKKSCLRETDLVLPGTSTQGALGGDVRVARILESRDAARRRGTKVPVTRALNIKQ